MKGISPLIATILLIAIAVSVTAIVGAWFLGLIKISTGDVGQSANIEIICNNGGISLSDVYYCNGYMSGFIKNTGTIALGNISITIFYSEGSVQRYYLSYGEGKVVGENSCCGNLTMLANERYKFNISSNSNYSKILISTNCTRKVTDEVEASEIISC